MRFFFVAALAILFVDQVAGSMMVTLAGAMGVKISAECKEIANKWAKYAEKELYDKWLMNDICKNKKCTAKFKSYAKAKWTEAKQIVEAVMKKIPELKGINLRKLPGICSRFDKDLTEAMWKFADEVADECFTGPKSPGMKDLAEKDLCSAKEADYKGAMECVKGKIMGWAIPQFMPQLPELQECGNFALEKYCNKKSAEPIFEYFLVKIHKDQKLMGKNNAYARVTKFSKDCK